MRDRSSRTSWHGPEALRAFLVSLGDISLDQENARDHDQRNMDTIKASLEANGQVQVLVVYDGVVMAGNARLQSMRNLGWTHAAILDVTEHFESKEQAVAFAIMDNRSGELADWNQGFLLDALESLPEEWQVLTGFDDDELRDLFNGKTTEVPEQGKSAKADDNKGVTFWATNAQATVIRRAIEKVKEQDEDMSDGRALELVSGDFLAGA